MDRREARTKFILWVMVPAVCIGALTLPCGVLLKWMTHLVIRAQISFKDAWGIAFAGNALAVLVVMGLPYWISKRPVDQSTVYLTLILGMIIQTLVFNDRLIDSRSGPVGLWRSIKVNVSYFFVVALMAGWLASLDLITMPAWAQLPVAFGSGEGGVHPGTESMRMAKQRFPELTDPNSSFTGRFRRLYHEARVAEPDLLTRSDWPLVLAQRTNLQEWHESRQR